MVKPRILKGRITGYWLVYGFSSFPASFFRCKPDPLLLGTLLYYMLLSIMVVGYDRYRLAVEPLTFVMLARGRK